MKKYSWKTKRMGCSIKMSYKLLMKVNKKTQEKVKQ